MPIDAVWTLNTDEQQPICQESMRIKNSDEEKEIKTSQYVEHKCGNVVERPMHDSQGAKLLARISLKKYNYKIKSNTYCTNFSRSSHTRRFTIYFTKCLTTELSR